MITIGCDPEFVLYDEDGAAIRADDLPLNCSDLFGRDGGGGPFEVRPSPSNNTLIVVENIRNIFSTAVRVMPPLKDYVWKAGHCPSWNKGSRRTYSFVCGGHIHVGGVDLGQLDLAELVHDLETVIMRGLSKLVDDPAQVEKRRPNYGRAESYRVQEAYEGGRQTTRFEYRTPGSYLISPQVTFLNLLLAKVVTKSFLDHTYPYARRTPSDPKTILKGIWDVMCALPENTHTKDIKFGIPVLWSLISKSWKVDWDVDFRKNWGIR